MDSIAEQFDPLSPPDRDQCCVRLEQEVILSFRLLFGQDGKPRKVAREELSRLKSTQLYPKFKEQTGTMTSCEVQYSPALYIFDISSNILIPTEITSRRWSFRQLANLFIDHRIISQP